MILQSAGQFHVDNCAMNRRTFAEVGGLSFSGLAFHLTKGCWLQGPITPFLMSNATSVGIGGAYLEGVLMDTSFQPAFANWSPGILNGTLEIANDGAVGPTVVTGSGVANLIVSRTSLSQSWGPATLGQTKNYVMPGTSAYVQIQGANPATQGSVNEKSGPDYEAQPNPGNFFIEQTPAPPTTSQFSGGSLTGPHYYGVVAHFHNGTSRTSTAGNSVTMSGGNGTTVTTWTAVPGALSYDVWDLTRGEPTACVGLTALTCTDTGGGLNSSGPQPNAPSDGYPSIGPAGVYSPQISVGGDSQFSASPRPTTTVFLPGALTSTWTGGIWTLDKAITVTRVQVQAKTAPSGCSTNAVVRVTDGTSPINVTVSAAANDSGAIAQNYGTAASLTITVQTAASGCGASPADANLIIQYRMQ